MHIMLNSIYKMNTDEKDTVRILYIFEDAVVVISMAKENTLPYLVDKQFFIENVENGNFQPEHDLKLSMVISPTEKQKEIGEANWSVIGNFVLDEPNCFDKKKRSQFISEKSKESGKTRFQIQRFLYKYWAGGKTSTAVYPSFVNRGGPGKERLTEKKLGRPVIRSNDNKRFNIGAEEKQIIESIMDKYYNRSDKKYTYHDCYKKMLSEHYSDPVSGKLFDGYPTEAQFKYHASQYVNQRKRVGSIIYDKDRRGITGSSRSEADGPGDTYQIDATIGDIYLVSRDDRRTLVGRPILYFVVDMFSRMITGFHCCLEYASWETARAALLCAFSEKKQYCAKYGVEINEEDWPCFGLPRNLIVDNGELISIASDSIISGLGITVKNAAAWRPDMKGIVESSFRLLNLDVKSSLPGGVYPDFALRTGRDYRYDARLTLDEFTQIIIQHILGYNKRLMKNDPQLDADIRKAHVPSIPIELWKWGQKYRIPSLREVDEERLRVLLSVRGEASVTEKGILFHNLYYECDTAIVEQWFDMARGEGTWRIPVAYDPTDMSEIFFIKNGNEYEICHQTADSRQLFSGLTLEEIMCIDEERKSMRAGLERDNLQNQLDTSREIQKILDKAEAAGKMAPIIKIDTKNIKENRKKEIQQRKAERSGIVRDEKNKNIQEVETIVNTEPKRKVYTRYDTIVSAYLDEEDELS